ncbi:MAG TPA: hypothetical protein VFD59_17635 [Nocardioidaceae bacterium]|nr:hypothetical protein [Nocardioidaceae bacterium]
MNITRFAVKAFAGTLATTVLVLGSLAGPAQAAKKDTGWGAASSGGTTTTTTMRKDTGWG